MNVQGLRDLYNSDPTAQVFFDHMVTRQRNQTETKVDRIIRVLQNQGHQVSRGQIVNLFKTLQELGLGQFVAGRWGWPSRFVWDVELIEAAKVATGEETDVGRIGGEGEQEEDGNFLTHTFNLRPDLQVRFELPVDLTVKEAQRLAQFIGSLPMEEYE